jgi:hypothetical protein
MQKTYKSLYGQMAYTLLSGLQLLFIPNMLLSIFGFEQTTEIWIRILGMLVLVISILYFGLATNGNDYLARLTIIERLIFCGGLIMFVLLGLAKTPLLLFAVFEIGLALWTWWELKAK